MDHLILHLELHCSSFEMWQAAILIEWLSFLGTIALLGWHLALLSQGILLRALNCLFGAIIVKSPLQ